MNQDSETEKKMKGNRRSPEENAGMLRLVEQELANGQSIDKVCRNFEITEETLSKWRQKDVNHQAEQAKQRLKELKIENARLESLLAHQGKCTNISINNDQTDPST